MGKLHFWPHSGRNHREYHPAYGFHQMRLSDEPGCYEDDFGRWLLAQGPEVRRKANVPMPGERGDFNYYTFEGDDSTTHAHWVASETVHFIEETTKQQPNRPFFVNVGFYHPHPPLNPPASQLALYKDRTLPPRRFRADEADFAPPNMKKTLLRLARTPEDTWTAYRKHFYAMVSELDRNIGRIIDSVERLGQMDNTLFILTSDHGDYLGDHNLNGKSAMPYDGSMRVPLIFRGPGIPSGVSSKELCEMVDIMPTALDILGIAAPKGNQGASLLPVMKGGPGKPVVIQEGRENRIIRTPRAKYCLWKSKENHEVLFDHQKDPDEFRNIVADSAAQPLLNEMRLALSQRMMDIVDPLPERVAPY
jgi:arylsulfatase A-like enzyme